MKTPTSISNAIALANCTGKPIDFVLPWNADEDYVRRLNKYVEDNLHPDLKCHIEMGNEDWG